MSDFSLAQNADELRAQIESTAKQIEAVKKEIERISPLLTNSLKQTQTLQNTLKTLELTSKRLTSELELTNKKISSTSLNLTQLNKEIRETEMDISDNLEVVARTMRILNDHDSKSLIQKILSEKSISTSLDDINAIQSIQGKLNSSLDELKSLRKNLDTQKSKVEKEKNNLVNLQKDLSGQKQALQMSKNEQSRLLSQARKDATAYQRELDRKIKEKEAFERELFEAESRFQIAIDQSALPNPRPGVISWPIENVFVTQRFGKTIDSKRLYVSGTHNGVDFRASIGTPIMSVLSGVVQATGNTDSQRGCYSYGKWVLIKHPNGLSSLYAHLSVISVNPGEEVRTGDKIGYSGNTGYSTGPHLHLGVFASQGIKVQKYTSSKFCTNVTIPMADVKAYLDPLSYLPAI